MRSTKRTLRLALCAGLALCALLAVPAPGLEATIMRELSVEELSVLAPHVVRGTILGQVAQWSEDGKGILTYVDVSVHEQIKGDGLPLPATIQIVQPGGELDGIRMRIIGGPVFRDGEELVLFLDRYSDNPAEADLTVLVGGAMGRMPVVRDPAGQAAPYVIRQFDDLEFARFVEGSGEPRMEIVGPPPSRNIPLDDLKRRVREAAASRTLPGLREATVEDGGRGGRR